MRSSHQILTFLALVGIFALSACAQLRALPNLPNSHPEKLTARPDSCSECHEDQQKGTMKPFLAFNHSQNFIKNHRLYVSEDNAICEGCHKKVSFCNDCHSNKADMKPATKNANRPDRMMPHRGDFLTLHKIEGKLDPASCFRCHGRSNNQLCVACHR